ncbi:hypothetical protein K7X08_015055 [Anisodus acutangulus]|uniref:GPI-anchored protein LLG1-like domain-containing protein n=1 Tax=Anisodus acutangulus TaxID=402998 RepID=A0A9Q1L3R9_9SOLA|nr:hypothetical protein K7X08_015055 [Anisodus acutangulus]
MDWRHTCSCFILLFFFSLLPGILTSTSTSACPVTFESQNYTIITSQCKPPEYQPAKQCCDAFLQFACPFEDLLNDLSNGCSDSMFSYIHTIGYPTGLFGSMCKGTKEGLECPALAPSRSADDTNSSRVNCKLSPVLMIATGFLGVLMLVLLF